MDNSARMEELRGVLRDKYSTRMDEIEKKDSRIRVSGLLAILAGFGFMAFGIATSPEEVNLAYWAGLGAICSGFSFFDYNNSEWNRFYHLREKLDEHVY